MNDFVINALEIIFGIWFLNLIVDLLFDIDIIEYIKRFINKLLAEK